MNNDGTATVTGGTFDNFTMNSETGELTITHEVDLDWNLALDPLTADHWAGSGQGDHR